MALPAGPAPSRWSRAAALVARFLAGQGAVQSLTLVTGFLLLRWLAVVEYAQYSVASAFQSVLMQLVDVGFGGAIVALVGSRYADPVVVGRYVRAARTLRFTLTIGLGAPAVAAFWLLVAPRGWSSLSVVLLGSGVLGVIAFQGWCSYYAVPLLVHQRLGLYYGPQVVLSALRLVGAAVLFFAGALTGWAAVWLLTATTAIQGLVYRRAASRWMVEPRASDAATRREILKYIGPIVPGVAFAALLGQIPVLFATIFGRTVSIAEVGALGRLGQAFLLLTAFNAVIVGPRFARLPDGFGPLLRRYAGVVAAAWAVAGGIAVGTALAPQPVAWVLGPSYHHLTHEVVLTVAGAGLTYVGTVMWTIHAARRWVFWWSTGLYITLVGLTQAAGVLWLDLGTTLGVVQLSVATAAVVLLVHVATAVHGFRREARAASVSLRTS